MGAAASKGKVDEKLSEAGAIKIIKRGEADARGDFFGDFDNLMIQCH